MLGSDSSKVRTLAAWALVAYGALALLFAFLRWVTSDGESVTIAGQTFNSGSTFAERSYASGFLNVVTLGLIVLAVVLVAGMRPALPASKLVATLALLELAVALVFGLLTWLIGFGVAFDGKGANGTYNGLEYLLEKPLIMAAVAAALLWVLSVFTASGGRLPNASSGPSAPTQTPGM
jgi:hypothetical protein